MNEQTRYIEEDEIDLREIWKIIVERKTFIIIFTLLVTVSSIIYVFMKNPTPIYSGNIMIEIGEVKSNNPNQIYLDNSYNLKQIIEKELKVDVAVPKESEKKLGSEKVLNNILIITFNNTDKIEIKQKLLAVKNFVLSRHNDKVKLYDTYTMTKQIGDITINDRPINTPKKKLIVTVSFVTGLILSIFIVFLLDFFRKNKEN